MDLQRILIMLATGAIGTLGFSILFYIHPRRLPLATLGGILCTAVYLLAGHWIGGELLPNLLGAVVGAGFSEICARMTKVPVPIYMVPCVMPLVPGKRSVCGDVQLRGRELPGRGGRGPDDPCGGPGYRGRYRHRLGDRAPHPPPQAPSPKQEITAVNKLKTARIPPPRFSPVRSCNLWRVHK